ncbi:hypothetical protein SISNIDRAFT_464750 [Sistotremastrum niveocremeum HHB9708]|uniref:Uncharacterized protein n=2 Tax=Sistotremastraceae TaxID=3402574 RepID=A0A164WJB3_9AGAM|nr:hypothetical protein SISNIDRAFT_464750 [Sistotremastrum niveocremeum HHB9708]KZT34625.1 hypothetical protein SISSUDRAFT_1036144 [Sistotremastrum suecicum HHB10207 ss-3]
MSRLPIRAELVVITSWLRNVASIMCNHIRGLGLQSSTENVFAGMKWPIHHRSNFFLAWIAEAATARLRLLVSMMQDYVERRVVWGVADDSAYKSGNQCGTILLMWSVAEIFDLESIVFVRNVPSVDEYQYGPVNSKLSGIFEVARCEIFGRAFLTHIRTCFRVLPFCRAPISDRTPGLRRQDLRSENRVDPAPVSSRPLRSSRMLLPWGMLYAHSFTWYPLAAESVPRYWLCSTLKISVVIQMGSLDLQSWTVNRGKCSVSHVWRPFSDRQTIISGLCQPGFHRVYGLEPDRGHLKSLEHESEAIPLSQVQIAEVN